MQLGWIAVLCGVAYIAALFGVAWFGDRRAERGGPSERPLLYALAISVYCTSWTFFGSVGVASRTGLDFLPIYIGPILLFTLGYPILRRVIRVSKAERITSVADFVGARYGKNQAVAVVTTLIAVTAAPPYIALQLKAISASVETVVPGVSEIVVLPVVGDLTLLVAAALALFAILFGTRHADATEHQNGMVLAIAVEAIVKLLAFLAVGIFITFIVFGGPADLYAKAAATPEIAAKFARDIPGGAWLCADDARRLRLPASAAPVPHRRCREQQREGNPTRGVAVPRLSHRDQHFRGADRGGRAAAPRRVGRLRLLHAARSARRRR